MCNSRKVSSKHSASLSTSHLNSWNAKLAWMLCSLYSKGYCRPDHSHSSTSMSPPSTSSLAASSSVSPPSLSMSTTSRPRMPARSTSWNCHQHHQGHRSQESIKATELYLKGLEIEVDKPVESSEGNRRRGGRRMEEMESSEEDERAEGKYWNLQSALDLIVGVSSRFLPCSTLFSAFPFSSPIIRHSLGDGRTSIRSVTTSFNL